MLRHFPCRAIWDPACFFFLCFLYWYDTHKPTCMQATSKHRRIGFFGFCFLKRNVRVHFTCLVAGLGSQGVGVHRSLAEEACQGSLEAHLEGTERRVRNLAYQEAFRAASLQAFPEVAFHMALVLQP